MYLFERGDFFNYATVSDENTKTEEKGTEQRESINRQGWASAA